MPRRMRLGRHPRPQGAGAGGEDVLHVVLAAQPDLGDGADRLDVAVQLGDDPSVADEDPVVERPEAAEPEDVAGRAHGQPRGQRIVEVQHRAVRRRLVGEDAGLGLDVVGHRAVAVEVVGRDVEHRGHPRVEAVGALELEARHLGHDQPVGGEVERVLRQRRADVARHQGRPHLGAEQLAGQRRRRGLAVGAGDRDDVGLHGAPAELELADDGHAARAGGDEGGQRRAARPGSPPRGRRRRTPRAGGRPSTAGSPPPRARAPPARSDAAGPESDASTRPPSRRIRRAAATPLLASPTTETVAPESQRRYSGPRSGVPVMSSSSSCMNVVTALSIDPSPSHFRAPALAFRLSGA